jgi:hypothetical protein
VHGTLYRYVMGVGPEGDKAMPALAHPPFPDENRGL